MLWSQSFIPTLKETPERAESVAHQLMLRAGLIRMLMAGVYTYLPLGLKVLNNIEGIIRQEMNGIGAQELLLPALQPLELWKKSGRDTEIGEVMIRFTDRRNRKISLGPTHEEVITELVKDNVSSYRQLPLILYQIQTKFRDEIRPRFGVVRACEFVMKDAYSFDKDMQGLDKNYQAMFAAYKRIFCRCGLNFYHIQADPGMMGGKESTEFMVPAPSGEDLVYHCALCGFTQGAKQEEASPEFNCPKCNKSNMQLVNAVEVGHIFKLGTKYSESLGARFLDERGVLQPLIMGCYGIGVSRLIAAIIEHNHDKNGIVWPKEISPYKVIITLLDVTERKSRQVAQDIYAGLSRQNIEALLDDRDERAGVKFKDADLIGICLQVVIGKESLEKGCVELKLRSRNEKIAVKQTDALGRIMQLLQD
ncbi:MAG: proline--tRNA ligase [Candidatus Omnitrophica bacterium]|nr:proline--tRNA ligase [Candidatus Omnitrophota bacterium]